MRAWLVAVLLLPTLSGCLSFLEDSEEEPRDVAPPGDTYDPTLVTIETVLVHGELTDPLTITAADGIELSAIIYEPVTSQLLPDGSIPTFPVVAFLHGLGSTKEEWQGDTEGVPPQPVDFLQMFADAGIIAVAYDARGFGQSGGVSTLASSVELGDLSAVLDYADERFATNGYRGVVGQSYGGGQALQALATMDVDTVVTIAAWKDLYEGLVPGNVPKIGWDALLLAMAQGGSGGQVDPVVARWTQDVVTRTNMQAVEADMDVRSVGDRLDNVTKPYFVCQGIQESLFPQIGQMLEAPGYVRAKLFSGGHGEINNECMNDAVEWFGFFLRGAETGADTWPFVQSVQVASDDVLELTRPQYEGRTIERSYLRNEVLSQFPSASTFEVSQNLVNNPFIEPAGINDGADRAYTAIPHSMREDPGANDFTSPAVATSRLLVGQPVVGLNLTSTDLGSDFQAVVHLYHLDVEGNSILLGRSAYAHVAGSTAAMEGEVEVALPFTNVVLGPGEKIIVRVAGNDATTFEPLPANYSVNFNGGSWVDLPYFDG